MGDLTCSVSVAFCDSESTLKVVVVFDVCSHLCLVSKGAVWWRPPRDPPFRQLVTITADVVQGHFLRMGPELPNGSILAIKAKLRQVI